MIRIPARLSFFLLWSRGGERKKQQERDRQTFLAWSLWSGRGGAGDRSHPMSSGDQEELADEVFADDQGGDGHGMTIVFVAIFLL